MCSSAGWGFTHNSNACTIVLIQRLPQSQNWFHAAQSSVAALLSAVLRTHQHRARVQTTLQIKKPAILPELSSSIAFYGLSTVQDVVPDVLTFRISNDRRTIASG